MKLTDQIRALCDQIDAGAAIPPAPLPGPTPEPIPAPAPVPSPVGGYWPGPTIDTGIPVAIGFYVQAGGPVAAGSIATIEYPGTSQLRFRVLTLSQTKGDFSPKGPFRQVGVNPGTSFSVGHIFDAWPVLTPGPWFINISDSDAAGNPISVTPASPMRVTLTKPQGY